MPKKNTDVAVADEQALATVASAYQVEGTNTQISFPRIGLYSQDVTEGKGKSLKVTIEAGMFYIEHQSEELDENGKKTWVRDEIGDSFEGIIFYKRHQLRMFDGATEEFTSSPIYDLPDEILPLFCNKKEVGRGTPQELRKKYEYTGADKKTKTALEDNRIVYIIYKDEVYQMNLRGSSMYSLLSYERNVNPTTVITKFSSEGMKKGDNEWNKMTFNVVRKLTNEEVQTVTEEQASLINKIAEQKANFADADAEDKEF